jgi:hypothetical protein
MMSVMKALLDDLGHWVKPCGIMWFSKFFLTKYDEDCLVEFF